MKATVKKNAPELFMKKQRRMFHSRPLPDSYHRFNKLLETLAGQTLEVSKMYDDRVVLDYPEPIIKAKTERIIHRSVQIRFSSDFCCSQRNCNFVIQTI
jgi:hypothetical protein